MSKKLIIITTFIVLLFVSCKKEQLSGNDEEIVGTYNWEYTCGGLFYTCDTPDNKGYNLKLEIIKKGKYKLFQNGKKVGHGQLLKDDAGHLKFKNDELFGSDILENQKILKLRHDSLEIGVAYCCDTHVALFLKN